MLSASLSKINCPACATQAGDARQVRVVLRFNSTPTVMGTVPVRWLPGMICNLEAGSRELVETTYLTHAAVKHPGIYAQVRLCSYADKFTPHP